MSAEVEYLGPGSYGIAWPLLGGLLVLLLLLWPLVVRLLTRPPEDGREAPLPPDALTRARDAALRRIDEVESAVDAGELSARAGHHELSRVVRGFVAQVAGLDADRMTARELRDHGPEDLARVIEAYYPSQFGVAESERPAIRPAARAAREVVGGWR